MKVRKPKSEVSDSLDGLPRFFSNAVKEVVQSGITDMVLEAKARHRFKTRSGFLEKSVESTVNKTSKMTTAEIWLEDTIADYGKYIHSGFKSWAPDPFVEDAWKNQTKKMKKKLDNKIKNKIRG